MLLQNAEIYTNKINAPADIADAILIQRTQRVLREIIHSGRWDTDQGRKIFPEGKIRLPQIAQIYTDKIKPPAEPAERADKMHEQSVFIRVISG